MRTLAKQLSDIRTAKGLSQAALARLLGVSRSAVHNWEAGHRTPTLEQTCALATALECTVDQLVRPIGAVS
jgi:transcriptional regulator with XRE-family HTH domain